MKTIILEVLKTYRLRLVGFAAGSVAYVFLVCAVFHNLIRDNEQFSSAIKQLSGSVRSFVQIQGNFTSPAGFLGSEPYYVLLPLVSIILAIGLGATLIAREENNRTLELILARPIKRSTLLISKAIGGCMIVVAVNVVTLVAMLVATRIFSLTVGIADLIRVHLMLLLISLIFGSLAFCLSAIGGKIKSSAIGVSALLALSGYVLASLQQQVSWLDWPAKLLPYHYYTPGNILGGSFDSTVAIGYVCVIIIFSVASYLGFRHRDIG